MADVHRFKKNNYIITNNNIRKNYNIIANNNIRKNYNIIKNIKKYLLFLIIVYILFYTRIKLPTLHRLAIKKELKKRLKKEPFSNYLLFTNWRK